MNEAVEQYGGKGSSLMHLHRRGYNVPPFIVLSVRELATVTSLPIPKQMDALRDLWQNLSKEQQDFNKNASFAVRSSAVAEDGKESSFAGQFKTVLEVKDADVPAAISSVLDSVSSPQVIAYLQEKGQNVRLEMAVIIQQMVPATVAGVAFGRHPLSGNENQKVINAVAGLGDKLVDGSENADSYVFENKQLLKQHIEGEEPLLDHNACTIILDVLEQLYLLTGSAQDIEFAFVDDIFYLLQARPITATGITPNKIAWDNSNIIESYPGLTLPLTFSFIEKMYEAVYRQFSAVLGVSPKRVRNNETIYANMLGLLNGRVYYNLNNWYAALAQLPGYSINASFMEKMMGVKEKAQVNLNLQKTSRLQSWWEAGKAISGILLSLAKSRKATAHFKSRFNDVYRGFAKENFFKSPLPQLWNRYESFAQLMIKEWKAPLANDLFAMIYFGSLQKLCKRLLPQQEDLHNRLLAGSEDVSTTEPMRLLPKLAAEIAAEESLKVLALKGDPDALWKVLNNGTYPRLLINIQQYLEAWGERCIAELKLETITYQQDPLGLLSVLINYVKQGNFTSPLKLDAEQKRKQAELEYFGAAKGFLKKKMARHVLNQARYFVSNRENLRYFRTRGFGMVRRIVLAMGEQLHQSKILDKAGDVFYLDLSELEMASKGNCNSFSRQIAERKQAYALYDTLPLPERLYTNGQPQMPVLLPEALAQEGNAQLLQGIGCSPGVVRGEVCKITSAAGEVLAHNSILTTYATDPGYVVHFAGAKAILTERGSLLSHAAIVSREMGIPCVVGIPNLMNSLKNGDEVILDGSTGLVKIISNNE